MPNATITLNYGVAKQISIKGKNAANTSERPLFSPITGTSSNVTVTVSATGDPQVFSVVNNNATQNFSGSLNWSAKNELGNTITGQTFFNAVMPDPAVTIESTEL